jgi:hypothetical protein
MTACAPSSTSAAIAALQVGVGSRLLEGGRLLHKSERLLAHFQKLVREALA